MFLEEKEINNPIIGAVMIIADCNTQPINKKEKVGDLAFIYNQPLQASK